MSLGFRQTVTIEVEGQDEALVRRIVELVMVGAAVKIQDGGQGAARYRMTAQCDWLDEDGKVIPLDQVVAAAKEEDT